MGFTTREPLRGAAVWRVRLASAFRAAIACTIAGCIALYGPEPISHQISYPSVSYVTAILIVSDATLGTALMGCFHALCATVLVLPPSVLCLWAVGPYRFSEVGAAVAVAISAFFVGLPRCLPLLTKRIAFGELVIIYVGAVVHGHKTGSLMHPIHVVASSALGAVAAVMALLVPYPWLASNEVKTLFQLYTENASQRTNLYIKAYLSEDTVTVDDLVSQAKPIAHSGSKLLHQISLIQKGLKWERFRIRDFKRSFVNTAERLDAMETPIKGMEMALRAIPTFPLGIINDELRNVLQSTRVEQALKLDQAKCFVPYDDAMTVPERKEESLFDKSMTSLVTISPTPTALPAFFFLSCIDLLLTNSTITLKPESIVHNTQRPETSEASRTERAARNVLPSTGNLLFALKCSLSLGFAVLLGTLFNKKNGYWSGLTIAISFVTGRQPIFTVASARVHGTAIGTVYGMLGSCLLNKVTELRFVILLPWIIFTSLIQHSQMYGQAGGISAVLGALLILGRKNYGPTNEFAIARLTEVSIGLLCLVLFELLLQPARAATLAKQQLSQCLGTLDECIYQIAVCSSTKKENKDSNFLSLAESKKRLKSQINDFRKLTDDANSEPDFWFLPFRASNYKKLQETLFRLVDLLQIMVYSMEFLIQGSDIECQGLQESINSDLELMKECVSPCIRRLQKIASMKSLESFKSQLQERTALQDPELGNPQSLRLSNDAVTKVLNAFLQHSKGVTDKIQAAQGEEDYKGKATLHLNSLGFCISGLMSEAIQLEKSIKEMVRWENPSRHVSFSELFSKIDTERP